jgi:hypothetical protein
MTPQMSNTFFNFQIQIFHLKTPVRAHCNIQTTSKGRSIIVSTLKLFVFPLQMIHVAH